MKYRILAALLFLLSLGVFAASAQTEIPKTVNQGVINGLAISLPRPLYPPAARAVNAGGAVNVQVTIDTEGNVISATAVSGHPLLREVSVNAAKQAKFKPTLLLSQQIKISGIIVYNFVPSGPLSWRSVGYEIAAAEQAPALPLKFPAGPIANFLPENWNEEKTEILKLKALQTSLNDSGAAQGQIVFAKQTIDIASIDHKQVLGSLKTSLEGRLSAGQNDLWSFKLGLLIGKIYAQINDDSALRINLAELRQLEAEAPADLAKQLKPLSDMADKNEFSAEDKAQIGLLLAKLKAD